MKILEHQQQRLALSCAADELVETVPQIAACQLRWQLDRRRDVWKDAPQRRCYTGDFGGDVAKRFPQLQWAPWVVDRLLDHLDVRQVRWGAGHLDAVAGEHLHPP